MMKIVITLAFCAAVAVADVSHLLKNNDDQSAVVVRSDAVVLPNGHQYEFQTSNGISAQEVGTLKGEGSKDEAYEVVGSSQYTAPDGEVIQLSYVANELGYQPQGAHLPTPPPPQAIPEYIVRSLQYIAAHPPAPES